MDKLGFTDQEWAKAREKFAEQQFAVDLIGHNAVMGWLKLARRSLAGLKRKKKKL